MNAVLSGKYTFLDVPTGYGKSLVFMVLPSCVRIILEALGDANLQLCKTAPVWNHSIQKLLPSFVVTRSRDNCTFVD